MTNTTTAKITKKARFEAISEILREAEAAGIELDMGEITYASLMEFINDEIELLNKKAEAAKKRAADKKVEGDALRAKIYDVLSDTDFMVIDEIVKALDDEDVSPQMVTSRLTQLVHVNQVEKDSVTKPATNENGKSRKLSAYRKIKAD